jgi:hypothetical protein
MKQNVGTVDRLIRGILAAIIVVLYFTNAITGVWATVLLVIAAFLLLTAIVGYCLIYGLLGIHTGHAEHGRTP